MEKITKRNGVYYYGERRCSGADDVYRHFRDGYHASLGRAAYRRLGRFGSRTERVHEFGFVFDGPVSRVDIDGYGKLRLSLIGLVCGSYCWIANEIPQEISEKMQMDWFDWVLSKGSGGVWKTGKAKGSGRKDRRLNKKYR